MVRDNPSRTVVQHQNNTAEEESQSTNLTQPSEDQQAGSQEEDKPKTHPNILFWDDLNLEEDPKNLDELLAGSQAEPFPSHLRPFTSHAEYILVRRTYLQLQHSGYYWGSVTMEEAHEMLKSTSLGTFLIRDSGQPDVFFTLSYRNDDGPTSVRVKLNNLLFSLHGSHKTFESLFALLTYYTHSPCKLTLPYRRRRPECLKEICRRAFISTYGAESLDTLPGLSIEVKTYIQAYPYKI